MQFHLNGYEAGDPDISDREEREASSGSEGAVPSHVDVLIIGCGPAGLTLAAQLAAFDDISTCIVEQKSGRLLRGQADGIACRTMEMFNAFGFAERVLREGYWVTETSFWTPDLRGEGTITRTGRVEDVEEGLSEFPHVILNQARVQDLYLEKMRNAPRRLEPHYGRRFVGMAVNEAADADYPVTVRLERIGHDGAAAVETVKARYVVGCDGARSGVRRALGLELRGDAANQAWGVMDLLAVTDFPDIRLKSVIQSAEAGTIILIPREGGFLARFYVELDELGKDERVAGRGISLDALVAAAQRILNPYTLVVKEVAWWSVYEIGQRLSDRFDDVPEAERGVRIPHVFIAGDACHTHSPKAGQGMNVSMQDAFNLGWKLAAVLRGRSAPALLSSYSEERQSVAKELIDFDRRWASLLSAPIRSSDAGPGVAPAEVQDYFVRHGRYTAGTATQYRPSALTGSGEHQHLATRLQTGTRLHSAPVIRLADAKPMQLGHAAEADGRWRLYVFGGPEDPTSAASPVAALCDFLASSPFSPVLRYTPAGADIDAVIDVRAVFQQPHRELAIARMPRLLLPSKGRFALVDYEKMFCVDPGRGDIYGMRGIDRRLGCVVIVRPDQYVAEVLPIDAHEQIAAWFARLLVEPAASHAFPGNDSRRSASPDADCAPSAALLAALSAAEG